MINLQIVDAHKVVVESLSKLINDSKIARVKKVYHDLESCRKGLPETLPDILLLDIAFPDGDGVDFCGEIKKVYPELKIIMFTAYKEFNIAKHALHNGALGYILKHAESKEMFAGIEIVSRGKQFLCEEIDILLQDKKDEKTIRLSDREKEVLKYIADGYITKEIAALMFRDVETVRSFRKKLLIKLQARNTAEVVKKGYKMGLIR